MPGVTSGPALPFPYPAANRVRSRRPAGGSVIIAETVFPLPLSMALWTAVEYLTDVSSGEWWAKPR